MNVLVVAAHPDDEVLGCGATIAKHVFAGDEVRVVIMAEGVTSRDRKRDRASRKGELESLAKAASRANDILGTESLDLHDLPDNRLDSVDLLDIIQVVEMYIEKYKPRLVYTHYGSDLNIDHAIVNRAVVTACRPFPEHTVKGLLFFEVPSSTDWQVPGSTTMFSPDWFVEVTATLEKKIKALEAYGSEIRPWPHPRSSRAVENLALYRGSSAGLEAAEAFMLGRFIYDVMGGEG